MGSKIIKTALLCLLPMLGFGQLQLSTQDTAIKAKVGGTTQTWKSQNYYGNAFEHARNNEAANKFLAMKPYRLDAYGMSVPYSHSAEGGFARVNDSTVMHVFSYGPVNNHVANNTRILKRFLNENTNIWTDTSLVYTSAYDNRNVTVGNAADGSIVIAFRRYDAVGSAAVDFGTIRSANNGTTWSAYSAITGPNSTTNIPYGRVFSRPNGNTYFVSYLTSVEGILWESTDNGATWPASYVAYTANSTDGEPFLVDLPGGKSIIYTRQSNGTLPPKQWNSNDGFTYTLKGSTNFNNKISGANRNPVAAILDTVTNKLIVMVSQRKVLFPPLTSVQDSLNIYINDPDSVFTNELSYSLKHQIQRPMPNTQQFYGYPAMILLKSGVLFIVTDGIGEVSGIGELSYTYEGRLRRISSTDQLFNYKSIYHHQGTDLIGMGGARQASVGRIAGRTSLGFYGIKDALRLNTSITTNVNNIIDGQSQIWFASPSSTGTPTAGKYLGIKLFDPENYAYSSDLVTGDGKLIWRTTENGVIGSYKEALSVADANSIFAPAIGSANYIRNTAVQQTSANISIDGNADVGGRIGMGGGSTSSVVLRISNQISGATTSYGIRLDGAIQSAVTTGRYFYSIASTAAAEFSPSIYQYTASQGAFGAGSTPTTNVGFFTDASLIGGSTLNAGFRGSIAAGATRYNLYMDGTANNYIAGNILAGSVTDNGQKLQITGRIRVSQGLSGAAGTDSLVVHDNTSKELKLIPASYYGSAASVALKENAANKQNSLSTDGSGVKFPTVDAVNAGISALNLTSGTYTPTLTNATNIASSTSLKCHYVRIGNEVTVTGSLGAQATAIGSATIDISLPVASILASDLDVTGSGETYPAVGSNVIIYGNLGNNSARLRFDGASGLSSGSIHFSFTYTVIP